MGLLPCYLKGAAGCFSSHHQPTHVSRRWSAQADAEVALPGWKPPLIFSVRAERLQQLFHYSLSCCRMSPSNTTTAPPPHHPLRLAALLTAGRRPYLHVTCEMLIYGKYLSWRTSENHRLRSFLSPDTNLRQNLTFFLFMCVITDK